MIFKFLPFLFIVCFFSCQKESKTVPKIAQKTIIEKKPKQFHKDITKKYVLGMFDYKKHASFVEILPEHRSKKMWLHQDTYNAFKRMHDSAKKDGINLKIISATRNFYEQKSIWERKWQKYAKLKPLARAKKILEFSSMPTTSRHHWGTDIDINNLNNSYFESGNGKKEYDWLTKNASKFGFYQPYTSKDSGRTGYNEEKWHWSYVPLAKQCLDFYNEKVTSEAIKNFKGADLASNLNVIKDYVNGINPTILNYGNAH